MDELLGRRIKALRIASNFTVCQVADQIGIGTQEYIRIEDGMNRITLDILSKIAGALGVTVGDITSVINEVHIDQYEAAKETSKKMLDMLDLFYANKHMYLKLKKRRVDHD